MTNVGIKSNELSRSKNRADIMWSPAINIIAAQYKYFFTLTPLCNLIARQEKNKVILIRRGD
jgi:hypothetical protein